MGSGHRHSYFLEISILVLLVPSDADDGGGGDGDFPTTLPAWQGPRGYHGQGSNIPFGESLTLTFTGTLCLGACAYISYSYSCFTFMLCGHVSSQVSRHET